MVNRHFVRTNSLKKKARFSQLGDPDSSCAFPYIFHEAIYYELATVQVNKRKRYRVI